MELHRQFREGDAGPDGELRSEVIENTELIDVALVIDDSEFKNTRVYAEPFDLDRPGTEGQSMESLQKSMKEEGLKVPIVVIKNWPETAFHLRAGFRRLECAKRLGWKKIPATILPRDTPTVDGYWHNIIENSTRKNLTSYEVANAAKLMRDRFHVDALGFASKTGYSLGYVTRLLLCIDKLPEEILVQWKNGARLSFKEWYLLSTLDPYHAIKTFHQWTGSRPSLRMKAMERRADERKLAPAKWMDRMQKIYMGIQGSKLDPKSKSLSLQIIELCMGQKTAIPGVYEPRNYNAFARNAGLKRELELHSPPGPFDPPGEYDEPPIPLLDDDVNNGN